MQTRFTCCLRFRLRTLLGAALVAAMFGAVYFGAINSREYLIHFPGDGCRTEEPHACTFVRIDEYRGLRWLFYAREVFVSGTGWQRLGPWTAVAVDENGQVARIYRSPLVRMPILGLGGGEIRPERSISRDAVTEEEFRRLMAPRDIQRAVSMLRKPR